jgi:hypothetical protein
MRPNLSMDTDNVLLFSERGCALAFHVDCYNK